jgi:hypothetical protein
MTLPLSEEYTFELQDNRTTTNLGSDDCGVTQALSRHLPEETEETHETLQDIQCPDRG